MLVDGETLPRRGAYLMIERFLGEGLRTRFRVQSYSDIEHRFKIGVELEADFADTEEAEQGARRQHGRVTDVWDAATRRLRLDYDHPGLDVAVSVTVETALPVSRDGRMLTLELPVPAGGTAAFDLVTEPLIDGAIMPAPPGTYAEPDDAAARARTALRSWRG